MINLILIRIKFIVLMYFLFLGALEKVVLLKTKMILKGIEG
jgi:hypothetical protein